MRPSMLDDDLYKFTMTQAILKKAPNAIAKYRLINRGPQKIGGDKFVRELTDEVHRMAKIRATDAEQVMWPDHCVQWTEGARFHPDLRVSGDWTVIQKGTNTVVDSYSAFYDNAHLQNTGLEVMLPAQRTDHRNSRSGAVQVRVVDRA